MENREDSKSESGENKEKKKDEKRYVFEITRTMIV
jgi:hypothetical protein